VPSQEPDRGRAVDQAGPRGEPDPGGCRRRGDQREGRRRHGEDAGHRGHRRRRRGHRRRRGRAGAEEGVTVHASRRALACAALVLLAGVWLVAAGAPAQAHALVASSVPANGSVVATAPRQVLVTFTEQPDVGLSSIQVLSLSGQPVTAAKSRAVPGHPLQLVVPLPASLPDGVYTVSWRTVSKVDGHVTGGSFAFGVGVQPGAITQTQSSTSTSPSPLAVAGKWAFVW